jgi:membrane protein
MDLANWLHPSPISGRSHRDFHGQPWYDAVEARFTESQDYADEKLSVNLGDVFREAWEQDGDGSPGTPPETGPGKKTSEAKTKKTGSKRGGSSGKSKSDPDSMGSLSVVSRRNKRL